MVFVPKYRKRTIFGQLRKQIGGVLRELCVQHDIELVEGHAMPDHVHLLLSIPPKYSVSNTVGFVKGKSAIQIIEGSSVENAISHGSTSGREATARALSGSMKP